MRVLVVEDHKRLAEAVAGGLRDEGMAVDVAFDGQDALEHVGLARYDVIVLDRDLPGVHGDQVCRGPGRAPVPEPGADADRGQHHRRPGRGPRPGRR